MLSVIISIIRKNGRLESVISFPTLPGYIREDNPIFQVEQNIDFKNSKGFDELLNKVRDQVKARGLKDVMGLGK